MKLDKKRLVINSGCFLFILFVSIWGEFYFEKNLSLLIVLAVWVGLLFPTNAFLEEFLHGYVFSDYFRNNPDQSGESTQKTDQLSLVKQKTLKNQKIYELAGRYIGYCERTLIFIFYLVGSLSAIAFLATAKSIYDYNTSQSIQQDMEHPPAHYFVLGSLMSYTFAIMGAFVLDLILIFLTCESYQLPKAILY